MKRRELIKKIEELGCVLSRHGGRHDWYTNPTTGNSTPVSLFAHMSDTTAVPSVIAA